MNEHNSLTQDTENSFIQRNRLPKPNSIDKTAIYSNTPNILLKNIDEIEQKKSTKNKPLISPGLPSVFEFPRMIKK
jgi:hypothetical protein